MKTHEIDGLHEAKRAIGDFDISQLSLLNEFHLIRQNEECTYHLDMVLESESRTENYALRIRFKHVQDLKIDSFGGTYIQITGLSVRNIVERGWENKNWEVGDYEQGKISFRCKDVSIISFERK